MTPNMILRKAKTTYRIEGSLYDDPQTGTQLRLQVDGTELSLADSLRVRNHSPSGFNIGYCGSGPAQSALAICLHLFESRVVAEHLYQLFKETFVARWQPQMHPFSVEIDLTDFLSEHRQWLVQAQEWEAQQDVLAADGLLDEAYDILTEEEPPGTERLVVAHHQTPAEALFQVGDVVQVTSDVSDNAAGGRAVVYETWAGGGVSLITERGEDLGGYDLDEQQLLLTYLYSSGFVYQFRSVSWLIADWHNGLFAGVFRTNGAQ